MNEDINLKDNGLKDAYNTLDLSKPNGDIDLMNESLLDDKRYQPLNYDELP